MLLLLSLLLLLLLDIQAKFIINFYLHLKKALIFVILHKVVLRIGTFILPLNREPNSLRTRCIVTTEFPELLQSSTDKK